MSRFEQLQKLVADALENQTEECVIWLWAKSRGYATIRISKKNYLGHRLSCQIAHGPPRSNESDAAHSCGIRACVNPHHLRWATRKENCADMRLHGVVNHGERNGQAKLTGQQVQEIRRLYDDRSLRITMEQLANDYGVSLTTIHAIITKKIWRHLKDP